MDNPLLYDLEKKASFERHHITDELPCSEIGKFLCSKREFLKIEETKATLGMSSHQLLSDPVQEEDEKKIREQYFIVTLLWEIVPWG